MNLGLPFRNFSRAVLGNVSCAAALLVALSSLQLQAAEHWTSSTTPDFEMYTTGSEKQAIGALKVFEQVRYFFMQSQFDEDRS